METLSPGVVHYDVVYLRTLLGVPVRPPMRDDFYDPVLVQAVRDFQGKMGLRPTGVVDAATWAKAESEQPGVVPEPETVSLKVPGARPSNTIVMEPLTITGSAGAGMLAALGAIGIVAWLLLRGRGGSSRSRAKTTSHRRVSRRRLFA